MQETADLDSVRLFVAVAQAGSLSAAAERLSIPLPTLSRRVKLLERTLRVQLLERSSRGTKLTTEGTALYEQASRGVELLVQALRSVTSDQTALRGRLRLSIPPTFEPWWNLLSQFQLKYPDIEVHVYSSERRVDLVEDGIDVALRIGDIADDSVVAKRIGSYRHVLVASPKLLRRFKRPQTPHALLNFPCGVWNAVAGMTPTWRLGTEVVAPRAIFSSNDYAQLRQRALLGDFVTELPAFAASAAITRRELVHLLPNFPLPEQSLNLLYVSHRFPSSIVRAYLDFCQDYAASLLMM